MGLASALLLFQLLAVFRAYAFLFAASHFAWMLERAFDVLLIALPM